jgi:hypothetical protein
LKKTPLRLTSRKELEPTVTETIVAPKTCEGDGCFFAAGERVATTRELRALALYLGRGSEIEQYGEDLFYVPSQDGSKMYRVQYGNGHEFCSCPDHNYHPERACKHILAVGLLFAKKRSRRRQAFIAAFAEA